MQLKKPEMLFVESYQRQDLEQPCDFRKRAERDPSKLLSVEKSGHSKANTR